MRSRFLSDAERSTLDERRVATREYLSGEAAASMREARSGYINRSRFEILGGGGARGEFLGVTRMPAQQVNESQSLPAREATPLLKELSAQVARTGFRTVRGYGTIFNFEYWFRDMWGPYVELIKPHAFNETLSGEQDYSLLLSHQGLGLATAASGRMVHAVDDLGLGFAASLNPAEDDARNLIAKLEAGSLRGDTSIGGTMDAATWNDDYDELSVHQWGLRETSVVEYGANPAGYAILAPDADKQIQQLSMLASDRSAFLEDVSKENGHVYVGI